MNDSIPNSIKELKLIENSDLKISLKIAVSNKPG